MAEIIDISSGFNNNSFRVDMSGLSSANFGPGADLLMNGKNASHRGSGGSSGIHLDDLSDLEAELNEAIDTNDENIHNLDINDLSKIDNIRIEKENFTYDNTTNIEPLNVKFDTGELPNIGVETLNSGGDNKTWDGYGKFNEIPVDPSAHSPGLSRTANMSREEALREKFGYLKKLEGLERKGAELTKKYTMESSLQEMMGEYEMIIAEKERENSVKFQGNMLSAAINGLEFLNNRFDPFDVKLDGWGEQFGENISDYDDIFGELHEKYKSKAKMSPELKLLFQLAGGAMMVHMTNTMFKSSMPNMDDIMRQNPELMQQFNKAASESLGKTNPGLSGFMNNMMSSSDNTPVNTGPPPAPMNTQGHMSMPPPNRPGFIEKRVFASNRPDMNASRGENLEETFEEINKPMRSSVNRPEMKSPSSSSATDVENILSSLKTKNIEFDQKDDSGSTVSISELKELSMMDGKGPSRSKRRKGSEKNVVSLDI